MILQFYVRTRIGGFSTSFVVHGEPEAAAAMAGALKKLGIANVSIPERGQKYRF